MTQGSRARTTQLLERSQLMASLAEHLRAVASTSRGRVVLVAGEAGVGGICKMQAQLTFRRFPSSLVIALFAIVAAVLLGGTAGYLLKPASVTTAPTRVIVVHDESGLYASGDAGTADAPCVWIDHQKSC